MTNNDLSNMVKNIITSNGINKSFIARQLGIHRQAFDKLLEKKQFSIDDANRILNVIGYEVSEIAIKKVENKQ